jgi:hypothetical protein
MHEKENVSQTFDPVAELAVQRIISMSTRNQPIPLSSENGHSPSPLSLHLDPHALLPIIQAVVAEVLAQTDGDRKALDAKLAFSEEEAARLLSLEPWVLRDERLRGRIQASQIVGKRIRYTREDLVRYLAGRRWKENAESALVRQPGPA